MFLFTIFIHKEIQDNLPYFKPFHFRKLLYAVCTKTAVHFLFTNALVICLLFCVMIVQARVMYGCGINLVLQLHSFTRND